MLTIDPPQSDRKPLPAASDMPTLDLPGVAAPVAPASAAAPEPQRQGFTLHLPEHEAKHPAPGTAAQPSALQPQDAAADVIRGKIERLYKSEPDAKAEIDAVEKMPGGYSKHQEFVMRLVNTGRPLSEIQDAWHAYYAGLPDQEKHEVWQEFYSSYEKASKFAQALISRQTAAAGPEAGPAEPHAKEAPASQKAESHGAAPKPESAGPHPKLPVRPHPVRPSGQPALKPIRPYAMSSQQKSARRASQLQTIGALKSQLVEKITARSRTTKSTHFKSLAFGLATGAAFIVLILFSFFNERFITPFIMPGKASASTRLIIDPNQNADVGPETKIIIPKLNVEVPVVYGAASIEENDIQRELENGVVHYPITEKPGELGNAVIVGHSSNNILNKGKYKFAFLMLKKLEAGDTFYIHYNSKRFVYKIYESKIVDATDVSVLEDTDRPAVMTLITCDPPGTSVKRLIVRAEQISPEPTSNTASTAVQLPNQPEKVPGNSQSLFQRMTGWIF